MAKISLGAEVPPGFDAAMRWLFSCLGLLSLGVVHADDAVQLAAGAVAWERPIGSAEFTGVSFSSREATFRIIDNPPGDRVSLAFAVKAAGGVAGVNGGYFHEDFTPLGLVVSEGKTLHEFQKAKLLSGLVTVRNGSLELVRSGVFKGGPAVTEALQSGPWLVEGGAPVEGLNATRIARRTLVATDGAGHWALVVTSPLTLAETGALLVTPKLCGNWTVRHALNLDGGSSTALAAWADGRQIKDIPSFGPVRNYLAIIPRHR